MTNTSIVPASLIFALGLPSNNERPSGALSSFALEVLARVPAVTVLSLRKTVRGGNFASRKHTRTHTLL